MFTSLASLALAAVAARLWNIQLRTAAANRGKQLRESNQRLSQIFAAANDGIFMVDPARDEIIEVNARAAEIAGYTAKELPGIPMSTIHPDEMPQLMEFVGHVFASGTGMTDSMTCTRKDGRKVPVEMSASVVHQAGRKMMLVIVRDISERVRAAESLRESERYLRSVIDSMFAFVGLYSLDGTLIEANQAPLDAAGIKREDVIGKPFWDTYWWSYSEDVQDQVRDALRRAAEGETVRYDASVRAGESEDGEAELITIDVSFGPLYDSNGQITQLVGSAVDISERKRAEEALRLESEITRNMSEGICLVRVEDGTIVYVNNRMEEIFGYNSGEMDWMFSGKLYYGGGVGGRVISGEIIESIEKTNAWSGDVHNVKKDGTPFWTHANVSTQEDPAHGTVLVSAVADITGQRRTEIELMESEAKFRGFIETSPDGMVIVDSAGQIMLANAEAQSMFGYLPEELLGRDIEILIPNRFSRHSELVSAYVKNPHARQMAESKELHAVRKDGREFPVEIALTPIQTPEGLMVLATVRDIAERKKAEQALGESEAWVRLLLDSTAEAIYGLDLDGNCAWCNSACVDMIGFESSDQLLGRNMHELIHHTRSDGSPYPIEQCRIYEAFRRGEGSHVDDEILWRADGTSFPAEYWSYPILRDGEVLGSVVTFLDITERRKADEALRASEQQLHQAQKMDALGQLAGGVAHDFNNMLQAIMGYTGLAIETLSVDDPIYEDLKEVMDATERSTALVRRLLTFSRTQPNEQKAINLDNTVSDLLKLLSRVLGEQVELTAQLQSDGKSLLADPSQIEQLLVNLCINARDAMPAGGTITIETDVKQFDKDFCDSNPWASEGEYVMLSVTDSGEGIAKEIQDRVFEPFFTTKERGSGTGLGLAAAYAIVTRHGGFLKLDSEPGKGSRFSFFFPTAEPASSAEPRKTDRLESIGGSETILYAEDEELIRKLGEHLLEKAGYSVLSCADGEEAIRKALEQGDAIDLAILDVVMPKTGGKAVFDAIREIQPTMPVLFTSGYSFDLLGKEFLGEEHVALISKPHTASELLQAVRKLLG